MKRLGFLLGVVGMAAAWLVSPASVRADDAPQPDEAVAAVSAASGQTTGSPEALAPQESVEIPATGEQQAESTAPKELPPIRLLGPDGQRLTAGSVWVSPEVARSYYDVLPAAAIPMTGGEFRPTMRQIRAALGGFLSGMVKSDEKNSYRVLAMSPGLVAQVVTGWTPTSGPLELTLRPARRVELRLEKPDGKLLSITATVFAGNPDLWIVGSLAGREYPWPRPFRRFNEARPEAPSLYSFDADPDSTVAVYVDAPGPCSLLERSCAAPGRSAERPDHPAAASAGPTQGVSGAGEPDPGTQAVL